MPSILLDIYSFKSVVRISANVGGGGDDAGDKQGGILCDGVWPFHQKYFNEKAR